MQGFAGCRCQRRCWPISTGWLSPDDAHPAGDTAAHAVRQRSNRAGKTGSGKTAAFAIPLLAKLDVSRLDVQALVLCPTRELAEQVTQELRRLARAEDNVKILTLAGGVMTRPAGESLDHGAHIAVGTPGRIMDLLDRGNLDPGRCRRWCSTRRTACWTWAFTTISSYVARRVPTQRQTLLFSGNLPRRYSRSWRRSSWNPQRVTVQAQHEHDKIRQAVLRDRRQRAARHRKQIAAALSAGEHARVLANTAALP